MASDALSTTGIGDGVWGCGSAVNTQDDEGCASGLPTWGPPVQAAVPLQANFDNSKFQGLWYITAAASDDEDFLAMKEMMKMPVTLVTLLANGDLSVKTVFPGPDGRCQKVDVTFTKGAMPGQFSNPAMGQEDISVLSSDYKHYAILRIKINKGPVQRVMMQLYCMYNLATGPLLFSPLPFPIPYFHPHSYSFPHPHFSAQIHPFSPPHLHLSLFFLIIPKG
uniref:Lipocalin-like 1 protein n=1 Tax=Phascolarctos cinereus TaxID=38626 RepID=A0A6P5JY86_PHACI|nr:lipocalin-like 1 protein [Phascolarctos cinereus]